MNRFDLAKGKKGRRKKKREPLTDRVLQSQKVSPYEQSYEEVTRTYGFRRPTRDVQPMPSPDITTASMPDGSVSNEIRNLPPGPPSRNITLRLPNGNGISIPVHRLRFEQRPGYGGDVDLILRLSPRIVQQII